MIFDWFVRQKKDAKNIFIAPILMPFCHDPMHCNGPYLRAVSEMHLGYVVSDSDLEYISSALDLDFGFIGGAIVATGLVLSKPSILAFF